MISNEKGRGREVGKRERRKKEEGKGDIVEKPRMMPCSNFVHEMDEITFLHQIKLAVMT